MPSMPSFSPSQGRPLDVPRTMHQALELHHQGRLAEAEPLYAAVLAVRPDHFDALQMLGVIKLARGDLATALRLVSAAMQVRPKSPQVLLNLGLVLNALNRPEEALASFDEALKHKGRFAEALNNRGSVLVTLGRGAEALDNFKRAITIKPDYADAFYNQGKALQELGRYDEALKSYDRAVALRANHAKAHCNRGSVLDIFGRPADALACYDRALAIAPDFVEAMHNRCGALRVLKRVDEAVAALDRLLAVHPAYAKAHVMRGMMMGDFNRAAEAVASFERAAALQPDYSKAHWGACTAALPILYAEEGEIARQRADYERRLRAMRANYEAGRIPADMSKGLGMAQPFFLAYQGHNDRELQGLFGELASKIMADRHGQAELAPPPAPGEPIRVGIVSGFFFQHSVWKIGVKGWVTQFDRERFQVFGYHTGCLHDAETEIARQHCHRFVQGPFSTERWRETILADRPHVLLYPDIGMSPEPAELAALRLAPLQCSYIGHPQTSGYPTMDCFLSGELIEPPDGDRHYTERLVRLPNAGFHYEPLALSPAAVTRAELGLRPDATAYWCAQSLFKYLPQHDEVFPRIAREAGDCQFVFIRHFGREVTELFQSRLERAFAAAGLKADDHCVFLPSMSTERFAAASALCDAMLDSIGWSGGNTTLEALAQDLPVITHQGALMRGRVSAGILRMMGMPETIADSIDGFVALAARIDRDRDWRAAIKRRVAADKHRLYRDGACIAALADFIDRAVRRPA
jgi:predicted O-linked N-acetylglucosamine transferase (SPINDLY family)